MKNDLGPLPTIHPCEKLVDDAERKLNKAIIEITDDLTRGEYLRVLTSVFSENIFRIAKYSIRHERHGKGSDKPGGLK